MLKDKNSPKAGTQERSQDEDSADRSSRLWHKRLRDGSRRISQDRSPEEARQEAEEAERAKVVDEARSKGPESANGQATHNDGISSNCLGKGTADNRPNTESDDVESERQQGDGSADAKFFHEKVDG